MLEPHPKPRPHPPRTLDWPRVIGWREWLVLPELGIPAIKVKVDTGARSSSLHAFDVERVRRHGIALVRFKVHPFQRDATWTVVTEAEVIGERRVRTSGGKEELRLAIRTLVELAGEVWPIELTLASRDSMGFRMLLGRQALRGRFAVDPGRSYVAGRRPRPKVRRKTRKKKQP